MVKPKIIVCATAYHPFVGGAEIAIAEVSKRLSPQYDFFILTARSSRLLPRSETRPEGMVVRLGWGTHFDKWLLPILIPLFSLRERRLSTKSMRPGLIVWGMDIGQGACGGAMIKTLFPRLPFILTVQYGESPERMLRGRLGLIGWALRWMLARADRMTAISGYLLRLARDFGYCSPATIIPNGVDLKKFENQELGIGNQGKKIIITVSRLVAKNGVDTLIRAFARVKKEMPEVLLHIIGDGPERPALEKLAYATGVRDATVFFAFVEAMAAGLPVIGTAVGGIPDVIEHEKTGLLAHGEDIGDLARQIIRLLRDSPLAQKITIAGKEKAVRNFDWDAIASAYKEIFSQELLVKKRIVVATGLFPPEIGGPATYTTLLTETLPQRGVGLRVIPFRSVRHLPKLLRHGAYFLKVLAASRGSDAIFAQDPVSTGFPALIAARMTGKPLLLKVVGDYAWEQYRNQESGIRNKEEITLEQFQTQRFYFITEIRRWIERWVARHAQRVIVPSEYLKGIVRQWGVAEENIAVIYNAFEALQRIVSKEEARAMLGISANAFLIVSVGRLVPWKGFLELIDALAVVRKESPEMRLSIIGAGPQEKVLRARIVALGLENIVSLGGSVAHADVLRHLRAADIFILNSSYEGFSHTLLEALAMEAPIMAADVGGNREVITDGVSGRLYHERNGQTLAREILQLYRHPEERQRFVAGAGAALRRFSKEAMLSATTDIIMNMP
ncbi:MAG: hypothetical protein Greene071436_233 [Parcubacteria group bacterium Greene0714_36]|nr:MAG: hypothetical protein Greene071436_233 [Parcubacteria group bacterium Greene0714_36]